jgi:O-acetyl-ADP-ribose deacetylase (regulator of RNase III)
VWSGGGAGEAELLASAYRRSLEVAEGLGCRTIAFPALSTGIYGYPPELAAPAAVAAVRPLEERFDEVRFVFLDEGLRRIYDDAAKALGG